MASPSVEELKKTAENELNSLGRVSHRLAMVDSSERLQKVLELLLPRLLKRIGGNHQQQLELSRSPAPDSKLKETHDKIHAKLVETLSHTMKRVKDDQGCKLPCKEVLQLLLEDDSMDSSEAGNESESVVAKVKNIPRAKTYVDPFTLNLALAFLTLGLPRCTTREEVEALLPSILVLVGQYSGLAAIRTPAKKMQSNQVGHLLLRAVEWLVQDEENLSKSRFGGAAVKATADSRKKDKNKTTADYSGDNMALSRKVCEKDPKAAAAVFDLLMDGILYQAVAGNVPPNGLSQAGHERLKSGNSTTARDWTAEKAPTKKLMEFKLALLDFIAPSRRWAIFAGAEGKNPVSVSRTVALMVVASGDPNPEVAARATTYLKMHHDSFRGSKQQQQASPDLDIDSGIQPDADSLSEVAPTAVGDPVRLTVGLLSLALGQTNSESALAKIAENHTNNNTWLGIIPEASTSSDSSQLTLSLKRRAVAESAMATILKYVADKIVEENPHLFRRAEEVVHLGTLPVLAAQRTLSNLRTSSGLSVLQAKPYVAAAQLLNALCIRVSAFYDSYCEDENDANPESKAAILSLMARSLRTACDILSPASSPISRTSNSAVVTNDGSISIRDACYGVVCSLSRSHFALAKESYIFTRGSIEQATNSDGIVVSVETASLLFGCATNELDRLRPRAVAALDALLGAYCRVFLEPEKDTLQQPESKQEDVGPSNPWAATTVSDSKLQPHGNANSKIDNQVVVNSLLPLLWSASQTFQAKASRVASARWASDLMRKIDVTSASHLLCFLAGDSDVTVSTIARDGLNLPSKLAVASAADDDFLHTDTAIETKHPDFSEFTSIVFPGKNDSREKSQYYRPQYWDFSHSGKAAALRFGLVCLFSDIYGGENQAVTVFLSTLTDTLVLFGSKAGVSKIQGKEAIELLEECARGLLSSLMASQYARALIVPSSSCDVSDVSLSLKDVEFLSQSVNSSRARRQLASCCGQLYTDHALWAGKSTIGGDSLAMDRWLQGTQAHCTLAACAKKLKGIQQNLSTPGETHGASFLGAQCLRAFRLFAVQVKQSNDSDEESLCWQSAAEITTALGQGVLHSDDIVANACADALDEAFSYTMMDAPVLDPRLFDATASALNNLGRALKKYSGSDHLDAPRITKIVKATGKCLAASTSGAGVVSEKGSGDGSVDLGPARLSCVDELFSLLGSAAFRADEEIALVVGEALALYGDAYPDAAVWNSSNDATWPSEYDEKLAKDMPPHKQVLYTLLLSVYQSNSPHKRRASAPALLGVVGRAASGVNKDDGYYQRGLVVEIKSHMAEVQNLFIKLLSDPKSKHLSRESCCLGLAACRGLTKSAGTTDGGDGVGCSTEELNHRLLRSFGQTTNFGGSAYQETPQQAAQRRATERGGSTETPPTVMEQFGEENEVGGASGLGEAALNSYKEMASAAVSLGRIDVLYALLMLSISNPAWFTGANKYKYSAASLLGTDSIVGRNSTELREALRPHLGKLIPRLLRSTHDPNKQTREQMSTLWVELCGGGSESRAVISQHLLPTVDTLIDDSTNKLWRARAGACGALAEIIVGRSWNELGGGPAILDDDDIHIKSSKLTAGTRVLRLFRVAMRALDDVRINVREQGERLARTIRGLSIRLCTRSLKEASNGTKLTREEIQSHERNASAASATVLRWLIKHGLNQQCDAATGICLSTLVEIIDVVQPKILQPLIPDLLKSLLFSMSGLEPSALNYLQARSGAQESDSALSYENLERVRLRLAQSGPLASAVTKLLGMLPSVSIQTQKEVVPQLDSALRESVGFATRAATADAVSTLCNSCPNAFKFSGGGNTNPSVRLLRALYFASERERGQGARDKMTLALGNLASLCPGASVRILARKACTKYTLSTGNNDDPASRRASAAALRSIAVRASNQLLDGGPSNVWSNRVLPVAYLGKKDDDAKIASFWREVWEEGSIAIDASHTSGDDSFGAIEEKLLPHLVEECCRALNDYSWKRRVSGSSALVDLCNAGVLSPCPRSTTPASSDAYSLKRSQRRAQASHVALTTCLKLLSKSRLWTGKNEVISSVVEIAGKWASAIVDKDSTPENLFGWTEPDECPWQPISVSLDGIGEDLFQGDGWFLQNSGNEEENTDKGFSVDPTMKDVVSSALHVALETDAKEADLDNAEAEAEGALDFEDCDKLPENDDEKDDDEAETSFNEPSKPTTFAGLVLFLLDQAMPAEASKILSESEEFLPYRVAAFKGLRDLMGSLTESTAAGTDLKKALYHCVAPRLFSLCDIAQSTISIGDNAKTQEPPVIIARAVDCLAVCFWDSIGTQEDIDVLKLATVLLAAGGEKQPAWTVREASRLCLASLASKCNSEALRNHKVVATMVECAEQAQKDRKFWKVRFSGLKLLLALVSRAGSRTLIDGAPQSEHLLLEAILPEKEAILKIARKSLTDSEAKVTALSSDIIGMMSWWP